MTTIQYTVTTYRDHIIRGLYELQQRNFLCDIEITTTDGPVHVHKAILATCESPVLHESVNIYETTPVSVKTRINWTGYCKEVVECLVRYLYTGEIKLGERYAQDFTKLCQFLKLNIVLEAFMNHMIRQNILNSTQQDGSQYHVSMDTCHNLSTLSEAAHTISKMETFQSFTPEKFKQNETSEIDDKRKQINDVKDFYNKSHDEGTRLIIIDDQDDDTQDLDLQEYKHIQNNTNLAQHSVSKVGNREESANKESNKLTNSCDKSKGTICPEKNLYYESTETSKKLKKGRVTSKNSSKTNQKSKTKSKTSKKARVGKISLKIKFKKSTGEISLSGNSQEVTSKPKRKRGIIHRWCRKCNVRFPEKDLRKHMRTKHPPFSCKLCDWTGLLKRELALHMYSKHQLLVMPERYPLLQCDHEGCTFTTLFGYALDRHKECHNRLVRHLCDVCGSSFATAGGLKEHSLRHADENPIHKCQICDAVFGWKCKLKSHEMREHGTYMLCEICTYKTKYKDKLTMHLHHEHGQPLPANQKIHRCDQCDFYCINRSKLRFHQIRHTGEKNYTCPQCGKSFLNQHQLRNHINSTHGTRTFNCHACSYVSKRKSELNNHIKSRHSEDRPFRCELCEYSCKLRGNLHKHIRLVHKVEVVTRNQLHQNMIETGKGYTELLDARRKDDIVIQPKKCLSYPKQIGKLAETSILEANLDNIPVRVSDSFHHSKRFNSSTERPMADIRREKETVVRNEDNFTTTLASCVLQSVNSGDYQATGSQNVS